MKMYRFRGTSATLNVVCFVFLDNYFGAPADAGGFVLANYFNPSVSVELL